MASIAQMLGLSSGGKRRNTKKSRLNKKIARIKKLERKVNSPKYKRAKALDAALVAADKKIAQLQGKV